MTKDKTDTNPIIDRFFIAVRHHITTEKIRGFKTFCDMYSLPRVSLLRLEKEHHRQFHPEWLALLVEKCGYSAHWLLTGKGQMKAVSKTN